MAERSEVQSANAPGHHHHHRGQQPPPPQHQHQQTPPPSLVRMVKSVIPVLPCTTVSTVLLGWIMFYLTCRYKMFNEHTFTLGHFTSRLQVYKLLSYVFIHKSMSSLVCNVLMLWYFGGAMEKNVGTVKYAYLTLLFTVLTGIIYTFIGSMMFGLHNLKEIQGFTTLAFACVGMSVFLSPMKYIVFIITIKLIYLPFILLAIAIFIPGSSIIGNICGLGAGIAYVYGRRFFPFLDLHEMTAASMERNFPFTYLKDIPGITFYSALWEVRNVEITDRCNPKPGSYPTQTYYFPPTTDSQYYQYSKVYWSGPEHQHNPSYGFEYVPRLKYDAGHGQKYNLGSTSGLGHNHYVGCTAGHGHSPDLGRTPGHRHSHDLGCTPGEGHGNDLGYTPRHGHCHNLTHNPGHAHTCDHKGDYQYAAKVLCNSSGLQHSDDQTPAIREDLEDSCSVVMN
ncbi:rhomboid domain-containing protein 2-like [Chiloscyllium plagiosum]|uniref:rhomboid domain-containing protein 2-like n=1 Tax=Chiloscyllium plagiosum TaxID=36176 RepID=UPI001CB83F2C|nr:rhomboid domain-containing protein 2-like [Chiloscyllium plagiosum]